MMFLSLTAFHVDRATHLTSPRMALMNFTLSFTARNIPSKQQTRPSVIAGLQQYNLRLLKPRLAGKAS